MAGYIMNLGDMHSLLRCIDTGVYATFLSAPSGYWRKEQEATCCDFATMKQGDNIYFFIERKIYGIGELINIDDDCKFLNFASANIPDQFAYPLTNETLLHNTGSHSINQRWLCLFKPSPLFFTNGIDMDELLSSNPSKFKMVRAFWKVSFIKIDDEENQAFRDAIIKLNEQILNNPTNTDRFPTSFQQTHPRIQAAISPQHNFHVNEILQHAADGTLLKHEMALELGLLHQLFRTNNFPNTLETFGQWDYLSHQVIASPFKPIDYMDKMDIFGYSYVPTYKPTRSKYLVIELKRGACSNEDVEQLLKYVDWVNEEYAFNDYSMIRAFLVGSEFSTSTIEFARAMGNRKYTIGKRPAQSKEWNNLKLVRYAYDQTTQSLNFSIIT